jgi:DNA repair protein RadC
MAHNHPSGEPAPSLDDVTLTRAAIAAGRTLGIAVLDHLIIGRDVGEGVKTVSLREQSDLGWDS